MSKPKQTPPIKPKQPPSQEKKPGAARWGTGGWHQTDKPTKK
jgi:hypothetical protein